MGLACDGRIPYGYLAFGHRNVMVVSGFRVRLDDVAFGCWYEIDGNDLVIYQFFRPTRIPISKIKSARKTTGYLATAGMSRKRVSISFIDRSVLKSYAPLEISPNDRDEFIAHLIELNPAIREIE